MSSWQARFGPSRDEIIEADCVVSAEIRGDSEVVDYPVEDGSQLSDHVTKKPRAASFVLRFTPTPDRVGVLPAGPTRPEVARRRLLKAAHEAEICWVVWDGGAYYPAILNSVSAPRDNNADGRTVQVEVREILIAESTVVQVPKSKLGKGVKHKFKKSDKGLKLTLDGAALASALIVGNAFGLPIPLPSQPDIPVP